MYWIWFFWRYFCSSSLRWGCRWRVISKSYFIFWIFSILASTGIGFLISGEALWASSGCLKSSSCSWSGPASSNNSSSAARGGGSGAVALAAVRRLRQGGGRQVRQGLRPGRLLRRARPPLQLGARGHRQVRRGRRALGARAPRASPRGHPRRRGTPPAAEAASQRNAFTKLPPAQLQWRTFAWRWRGAAPAARRAGRARSSRGIMRWTERRHPGKLTRPAGTPS